MNIVRVMVLLLVTMVLVAVGSGVSTASAQGSLQTPTNVTVRNGANPGEVIMTWRSVPNANFYRVGWVAYDDYQAEIAAGRTWLEAFTFVDVANRGQTARTIRHLRPGVLYAFIVASNDSLYGEPRWSQWAVLTLSDAPDSCPTTPPVTDPPAGVGDYDTDNDRLIEVANTRQLDAIRYDLDGDGESRDSAYARAFPNAQVDMGCPSGGCRGYELTADIDFGSSVSGQGWLPIGNNANSFITTFEGNGYAISNLHINRKDDDNIGLFGSIGAAGIVKRARLRSVSLVGSNAVGGLAGYNAGAISYSYVTGNITGNKEIGGLAGQNSGSIADSYSTVNVVGIHDSGGLVGSNYGGSIDRSHAAGDVSDTGEFEFLVGAGGLVGYNEDGRITASYANGDVSSRSNIAGGLVGINTGVITAVYARGDTNGGFTSGGLVGRNMPDGTIVGAYATGNVDRGNLRGGLVGSNQGTIGSSYSIGRIGASSLPRVSEGGLVGSGQRDLVTVSYWNTLTSGWSLSAGGEGKTTAEMQSPTSATGIYADWNAAWWDFGNSGQYPVLKVDGLSVADQRR